MGYTSSSFLDARQASGTLGNLEAEREVTVRKWTKWRRKRREKIGDEEQQEMETQ